MAQTKKAKTSRSRTTKPKTQAGRKTAAVKKSTARTGSPKTTKPRKTTARAPLKKSVAQPITFSAELAALPQGAPPHFIVFIPGFMGSKLRDRDTGEMVWLDFSQIPRNPLEWGAWLDNIFAKMRYPNERLEPAGIIDDVLFLPPLVKQEQYSRLIKMLEGWGYRADPQKYSGAELNVHMFAYDWRQDNRISGKQLGEAVKHWLEIHPGAQVWLMGHSNGGIVARWFIEKEGGKEIVDRLILLASPWDGAAKGLYSLLNGVDMFLRWGFDPANIGARTREILRTFPNIYALLPQARTFVRGADGADLDPFQGDAWLDSPEAYPLLADGKKFNQELGAALSVETLAFFGRKLLTTTGARVQLDANKHWSHVDWLQTEMGDGTVPEYSAIFQATEKNIPIVAEHGSIYVNSALQEILRWELLDKYTGAKQTRAALTTDRFTISFEPDKNMYRPGETIALNASVTQNKNAQAISAATIFAELQWAQALPGSAAGAPRKLPDTQLTRTAPGKYRGQLDAPTVEGYYRVRATVMLPGQTEITLEEIIAVENRNE